MEIYEAEDKEELRRALAMKEAMQGTPEDEMAAGIKAQKKKKKKKKTKASKKAGGGTVYRGRSYAYGGRVAKYKTTETYST